MTVLQVPRAEAEARIRQQMDRGSDLLERARQRPGRFSVEREQLARDVESWQVFSENVSRLLGVAPAS